MERKRISKQTLGIIGVILAAILTAALNAPREVVDPFVDALTELGCVVVLDCIDASMVTAPTP